MELNKQIESAFSGISKFPDSLMGMKKAAVVATEVKDELSKNHTIKTMWQVEAQLKKEGLITKDQALAFFCPIYFPGQTIVKKLLDVKDEHGETMLFPLPKITDEARIKTAFNQMERLGIKNPDKFLAKDKKSGKMGVAMYSTLPGIEGVASGHLYEYIAYEAVQLSALQIVPKRWLNTGDPYNDSYRFPGEDGFSPYWRIPPFEEFKKIRSDLASGFKDTDEGLIKKF